MEERYKYMLQFATSYLDKRYWEVGGNECLLVNNDEIVLCWVLVDTAQRHSFYSRFDFNKNPTYSWINKLFAKDERMIKHS
jgi:hypothetical protein